MENIVLHRAFEEAYKTVRETEQEFPPDVLLQFYALYKQATQENRFTSQDGEHELVSAFKLNALLQVKHMSSDEAKAAYIEAAKYYIKQG